MTNLIQDLIYGFRWFRTHPAFTLLSVLTLAAGIGLNTAMFSVIYTVLISPLPYPEADRLVWMNESSEEVPNLWVSCPNFQDWRTRNQSFAGMSLFRGWSVNMTGVGETESVDARMVTADYFRVMRFAPVMGRDFSDEDDKPGAAPVTIISYAFWQERFGGDPQIVGQSVTLDDRSYTIIGVMHPEFKHHGPPPLWLLVGPMNWNNRDVRIGGNVIARLKPGVSLDQARTDMQRISQDLRREYPGQNAGATNVHVLSLQDSITGDGVRRQPRFGLREELRTLDDASLFAEWLASTPDLSSRPERSEAEEPAVPLPLSSFPFALPSSQRNELKSVETEIKYAGYLDQQKKSIEKLKKAEQRTIPEWFNYKAVSGLSREMQEKLTRVRPSTIGQASRIPGVTPAALTLVNVYIEIQAANRTALQH